MDKASEVIIQELKAEIEVLKIQNQILMDTIEQANILMSNVPLWNSSAMNLAKVLSNKN